MSENLGTDFSSDDSIIDPSYKGDTRRKRRILSVEPSTSKKAKLSAKESSAPAGGNQMENLMEEQQISGKGVLFKKYFRIIEKLNNTDFEVKRNGVVAECCSCKSKLKGSTQITSNFVRHLKTKHNDKFQEYSAEKSRKERRSCQQTFNILCMKFIAQNMLPVSIVDDKSFQNMVTYLNADVKLVCRQTASKIIEDMHLRMLNTIKTTLKQCKFVCTTADIWSTKHKSFFGYTCHWIDESFQRKSIALACQRFQGSHSFDRIYDLVMKIHGDFGLNARNITATVTDNGSNFVKTFKEFGLSTSAIIYSKSLELEQIDDLEDMDAVAFSDSFFDGSLPKHIRCASHTFNLVATTDLLQILKNDKHVYEKHKNVMNKCSGLWNKVNRPKSSEQIIAALGSQLKYPVVTRWNSLFDSVKCLIFHKEKLNDLCVSLKVEKFHETDYKYLEEYLKLLQPIADAIDMLQREDGMVYGLLLPTLATTRTKFRRMRQENSFKYLQDVVPALQQSLQQRFSNFFDLDGVNDAIVASVLCPEVKLKWVRSLNSAFDTDKVEKINDLVKNILCKELPHSEDSDMTSTLESIVSQSRKSLSQLFDFALADEEAYQANSPASSIEEEFVAYMVDKSTSITMLNRYPHIKKAYLKYNTPLPSSAPVERLFSFASLLNTPRRGNLSDDNFEKLLLLKVNSHVE